MTLLRFPDLPVHINTTYTSHCGHKTSNTWERSVVRQPVVDTVGSSSYTDHALSPIYAEYTSKPFLALWFNIDWQDYCIWNQFLSTVSLLTIKSGKIKWRFSSCNCLIFFSSLCSLWHFALSCSSYMWTSVQCGFLVIHTYCILCCMGWTPRGHVTCTCIFEMMSSLA